MKNEEDYNSEDLSEDIEGNQEKIWLVVISSYNDTIKTHTNAVLLRNLKIKEININKKEEAKDNNFSTIIDSSKITKKLDICEVNELSIKELSPKIHYSIDDVSLTDNPNKFVSMEEDKHDLDQNSSELNHLTKNQKLSYDRIWFPKNIINTSNLPIKKMQFNNNVSYSTLSMIKRCHLNHISQLKSRNIVKVYGEEKEKLTNTIMKYIMNTKHTSTVKDITLFVNKSLNSTYFIGSIRVFMKNHINLSFKRVKSRPSNINLDKIFSIRNLFTIKILEDNIKRSIIDKYWRIFY